MCGYMTPFGSLKLENSNSFTKTICTHPEAQFLSQEESKETIKSLLMRNKKIEVLCKLWPAIARKSIECYVYFYKVFH